MEFDVVRVKAGRSLSALEGPWTEIERAGGVAHPMNSWAWVDTWWEVFGDTRTLTALIARDRGKVVAILPFVRHTTRVNKLFPMRRIEFLGTGEPEADEVLTEYVEVPGALPAEAADEMAGAGRRALGAWDDAVLYRSRPDSLACRVFRAIGNGLGLPVETLHTGACPYVALPASYEEYEKQLSSNRRQQVRRGHRALEKLGAIRFERAQTLPTALETLDILARLHQERWAARGKEGCFDSARFMRFHRRFIERTFPLGWPELWTLRLNGEPLVCLYNIHYQGRIAFYQSGMKLFDQEDAVRPGMLAHAMAIRDAIERGAVEYDFMLGDSRYKTSLSNASHELCTLRINRRTLREGVRRWTTSAIRRLRARRAAPDAAKRPVPSERQEG